MLGWVDIGRIATQRDECADRGKVVGTLAIFRFKWMPHKHAVTTTHANTNKHTKNPSQIIPQILR